MDGWMEHGPRRSSSKERAATKGVCVALRADFGARAGRGEEAVLANGFDSCVVICWGKVLLPSSEVK